MIYVCVYTNSLEGAALERIHTEQTRSLLNQPTEGQAVGRYGGIGIEKGQIPFQGLNLLEKLWAQVL